MEGDRVEHTETFRKLLCAIHGRPYKIRDTSELRNLTELADYYRSLPAVPRSVLLPLLQARLDIKNDASTLIDIAVKLRHEVLFRETVVFLAGNWTNEGTTVDFMPLDKKVKRVVLDSRRTIDSKVARVLEELLRHQKKDPIVAKQLSRLSENRAVTLPSIISRIYHGCDDSQFGEDDLRIMISDLDLMEECTVVAWSRELGSSGSGCYKNYFLCARVSDDDLPWDHTQKDF